MLISNGIKFVDDVTRLLDSLCSETNPASIKYILAEIVIYIRTHPNLRARKTESIPEMESGITAFLNNYNGENFEEIYSILREVIRHIPKFHVFNIDITELRDIAHDFDDAYRYNNVFKSFAADIRMLVHQHLSDKVIIKIEKLQDFLKSDSTSATIEGTNISDASREEKDHLLNSDIFQELLFLKDKLKIAWANSSNLKKSSYSEEEFTNVIELVLEKLPMEKIQDMPAYHEFMERFNETFELIKASKWKQIPLGQTRYYLKNLICEIMETKASDKGDTLFRLMTVDSLLEQISFLYYSNLVNSWLHEITDNNYDYSLQALYNLTLCTRAIGHGTKHLGRFAFLIEKLWKQKQAENIPSLINTMNHELKKNLTYLQEVYSENLRNDDKTHLVNRVMNNIIREKTTHILGNLINNITTYISKKRKERYHRVLEHLYEKKDLKIKDLVFTFGTDMPIEQQFSPCETYKACPEFMGGKGFSQASNSKIIIENNLKDLDVPKGAGFSTLTWYHIQNKEDKLEDFRFELWNIIRNLEERTGKFLGNHSNPLLIIARSGATVSLPGILDTISHIGINKDIALSWSKKLKEPRRAFQAYINFMLSYARSVLLLNTNRIIKFAGYEKNEILFKQDLDGLEAASKNILFEIQLQSGLGDEAIPDDPFEQLYNSTIAVFKSYDNEIVQLQAKNHGMPEQFQTACLVQECLPIINSKDCSGIFFTRDPSTGTHEKTRFKGQIEFREGFFGDVIADGTISPEPLKKFIKKHRNQYESLKKFKYYDERQQKNPTDIEFAIRSGKTFIVQSRLLKQSPIAMIKNSYELYSEKIINEYELIKRTAFSLHTNISHTYLDHSFLDRKEIRRVPVIASGKPVNGGVVRGRVVMNQTRISEFEGPLIFITENNVPPIVIMKEEKFKGYISKEGGITSHAALVAIGERKPCVVDVEWFRGEESDEIILGGTSIREGEYITLDANTGNIYQNEIPIIEVCVIDEDFVKAHDNIVLVMDELISFEKIS